MVNVTETFVSIQGESSYSGLTCFFVRLSGCNLRCLYCDTTYAYEPGPERSIDAVLDECLTASTAVVEITGGEPLLQAGFPDLARLLRDRSGRPVLVETNGSVDLSLVPDGVIAVMDVKCPGSGEGGSFDEANLGRLRAEDEVKFVLSDRADYDWARAFVARHGLADGHRAVFFSPVIGRLGPAELGRWMIEDGAGARLHVQLHKVLGVK